MTQENQLPEEFLTRQREKLEQQLRDLAARSLEARQSIRSQEHEVGDSVDTSAEEMDTAAILQLKKSESETMHQIELALERMADDEYNECDECGEAIGLRRLEVKPFALLCVDCQEELEQAEKAKRSRPGLIDEYM